MQLLERESPLACLLDYAAQARRGDGRLVLLAKLDAPTRSVAAAEAARRGLVSAAPAKSG